MLSAIGSWLSYAPVSLLALLPVWLIFVWIGYAGMFWAVGVPTWYEAFRDSGSSLLTLGFAPVVGIAPTLLAFSEATVGLILIALLIAYLPTIYGAFQRREAAVNLLEVRAGKPPSAVEMIERFHRIHGLDRLDEQWQAWETWFADIEESHTSLPALVFFRSPRPDQPGSRRPARCSMRRLCRLAALDIPTSPQAALCIRAGFLALRRIADFFGIAYDPDPRYPDAADQRAPRRVRRGLRTPGCQRRAAPGRPRAGLARLRRLAGELRHRAAGFVQHHDGAARALVVRPGASLPHAGGLREETSEVTRTSEVSCFFGALTSVAKRGQCVLSVLAVVS